MIDIGNLVERYPGQELGFNNLRMASTVECADVEGSWGSALSLSIEETLAHSNARRGSFIPSAGLLFSVFKKLHKGNSLGEEEKRFLREVNDYWHRTASVLVFPTEDKSGYVLHYPRLENEQLARASDSTLDGRVKVEISGDEFPPYGEVARIGEHSGFFKKVLGSDYLEGYDADFRQRLGMDLCMWIPPEMCILKAPEKLIIFGAITQYGMGLWLTSYTRDKALAGSRPFRLAYHSEE